MDSKRSSPERRKSPRYPLNVKASIKTDTSTATLPFELVDTTIRDVSTGGIGLSLTIETGAALSDLSKLFSRRRRCHIFCKIPGSSRTSCLTGTIAWVQPHRTSRGAVIQMGVSLEDSDQNELVDLSAYLRVQAEQTRPL